MLSVLLARLQQGYRTIGYPKSPPPLPDRLRGRPRLDPTRCPPGCRVCEAVCPTAAIQVGEGRIQLDAGRCLFCPECEQACPVGAVKFTADARLAATSHEGLRWTAGADPGRAPAWSDGEATRVKALDERLRRLFGRSLRLRQVSAGGCNACEADVNVLNTVVFDLGRFGIQFVASPRHADGLLITGPVTTNMRLALEKTYAAVPSPRVVIAVGACAISGGPYVDHPEVHNGAAGTVPVDLYIPGCPPHPITILDGLLRWLGRLAEAEPALEAAARSAPPGYDSSAKTHP